MESDHVQPDSVALLALEGIVLIAELSPERIPYVGNIKPIAIPMFVIGLFVYIVYSSEYEVITPNKSNQPLYIIPDSAGIKWIKFGVMNWTYVKATCRAYVDSLADIKIINIS